MLRGYSECVHEEVTMQMYSEDVIAESSIRTM